LVVLFVKLQPFVEKVAQRPENKYCKYAFFADPSSPKMQLNGKVIYKAINEKTGDVQNRYQAFNVINPSTVECRVFRGTLCVGSILAYVHFFHRLVEFAKTKINLGVALRLPVVELWLQLEEFLVQDELLAKYLEAKRVRLAGGKKKFQQEEEQEKQVVD
jgi:hypothetical protein